VTIPTRTVDPRLSPDGWEIELFRGIALPGRNGSYATLTDYITHGGSYVTYGDLGFVAAPGSATSTFGDDVAGSVLWVSQGIFAIQESDVSDQNGEAVTVIDGEDLGRKIDDATLMASVGWATTDTLETKLAEMVQTAVPYLTFQATGATHPAPAIVHERKASPLDILVESARSVGYEQFLRGYTTVWRPEPDLRSATPVCELVEGGAWIEGQLQLSRRDSHNAWTVVGRNPDAQDNAEITATTYDDDDPTSLTYWNGPFGRKPAPDERSELVDTQAKADAAVEALKLKNRGRSRAITVDSWPCAILEPGDAVTIRRSVLDVDEVALLDEVELGMSVKDGMSVVFRTKQTVSS
jgi:hypothetical protein